MIVFIKRIEFEDLSRLYNLYRDVFSGYPWYEDLACANCKSLYTNKKVPDDAKDRVTKLCGVPICITCNKTLSLVSYYSDIVDQKALIDEAINLPGFVGYVAILNNSFAGFTWGFRVPEVRTVSVDFPTIKSLLTEKNISPETAFYGAETGVIDSYQGKGIGRKLVMCRGSLAYSQGYNFFVNRTINPRMKKVLTSLFSNQEPQLLFNDPETKSPWFSYDFKYFNCEE